MHVMHQPEYLTLVCIILLILWNFAIIISLENIACLFEYSDRADVVVFVCILRSINSSENCAVFNCRLSILSFSLNCGMTLNDRIMQLHIPSHLEYYAYRTSLHDICNSKVNSESEANQKSIFKWNTQICGTHFSTEWCVFVLQKEPIQVEHVIWSNIWSTHRPRGKWKLWQGQMTHTPSNEKMSSK